MIKLRTKKFAARKQVLESLLQFFGSAEKRQVNIDHNLLKLFSENSGSSTRLYAENSELEKLVEYTRKEFKDRFFSYPSFLYERKNDTSQKFLSLMTIDFSGSELEVSEDSISFNLEEEIQLVLHVSETEFKKSRYKQLELEMINPVLTYKPIFIVNALTVESKISSWKIKFKGGELIFNVESEENRKAFELLVDDTSLAI